MQSLKIATQIPDSLWKYFMQCEFNLFLWSKHATWTPNNVYLKGGAKVRRIPFGKFLCLVTSEEYPKSREISSQISFRARKSNNKMWEKVNLRNKWSWISENLNFADPEVVQINLTCVCFINVEVLGKLVLLHKAISSVWWRQQNIQITCNMSYII